MSFIIQASSFLLADADISSVPADYVKNFLIMAGFFAALTFGHVWGRKGRREDPVHIHQPLKVRKDTEYALKEETAHELKSLDERIESMARENLRAHSAAQQSLAKVIEAGEHRSAKILSALHDMEQRMTASMIAEVKDVHNRINPIAEKLAAHDGLIDWIQTRLTAIWDGLMSHVDRLSKNQSEDTRRLHSRIDDAMTRTPTKSKA
jgi:hypothetical protein